MESLNIDSSSFLLFQLTVKTDQPENFIKLIYCKPCITRNCKYSKKKKKKCCTNTMYVPQACMVMNSVSSFCCLTLKLHGVTKREFLHAI